MRKQLGYVSHSLAADIEAERRVEADETLATAMAKAAAGVMLSKDDKAALRAATEAAAEADHAGDACYEGGDYEKEVEEDAEEAEEVDEELRAILSKATSGKMLTADEKARLKAEDERRKHATKLRAAAVMSGGRGGQGGRRASDSTAAAAPSGPAAWRTDSITVGWMKDVKGRPDMARKHRYKSACRDVEYVIERRKLMKQRFKDMQYVENKEARLLVMWFQARKIQRAFHAYKFRANAKASADLRRRREEMAAAAPGVAAGVGEPQPSSSKPSSTSPSKRDFTAERKDRLNNVTAEVTSITSSFQEFVYYKAATGTRFVTDLEKVRSRKHMEVNPARAGSSRRGKLQLEKGEIPNWKAEFRKHV
jgi:hypothetical protein